MTWITILKTENFKLLQSKNFKQKNAELWHGWPYLKLKILNLCKADDNNYEEEPKLLITIERLIEYNLSK